MALDMTVAAPSGVTFKDELVAMLAHHSANQPRSQQRRLGPSEVGHPCTRKLAYGLTLAPRCNDHAGDPLPSMVGTGAHAQMEDVLAGYNEWHGQRFLIENRVEPTPGFTGTMDAYDLRDHAVIDWKFPGTTKMSTVRRDQHPGILYEVQAHLYGLGALRAGLTPHRADRVHPTRRILHQHLRVGSAVEPRDRHGRHQSHDVDDRHGSRPPGRPASRPVRGVPRHPVPMRLLPLAPPQTRRTVRVRRRRRRSAAASTDPRAIGHRSQRRRPAGPHKPRSAHRLSGHQRKRERA